MLELGRERAVLGHRRPAVRQDLHVVAAGIDHGLDCKEHAFAQLDARARLAEVKNTGRIVEDSAEPMATKVPHHGKAVGLGETLDGVTDVADGGAGAHHLDATHHGLVSHIDQAARLHAHFVADEEHAARIAVPAVEDDGHVDVEDVALGQALGARDSVTDHMVDGGADGFGEAAVVERRGNGVARGGEVVAQEVECIRRHARHDVGRDGVERFGREPPGAAHGRELLRPVNLDTPGLGPKAVRAFHLVHHPLRSRREISSRLDRQGPAQFNALDAQFARIAYGLHAPLSRRPESRRISRIEIVREGEGAAILALHHICHHRPAPGRHHVREFGKVLQATRRHGIGKLGQAVRG
uniref:Uncharacterized protein n=1 Tax=uncultured marine microorganism HF4000_APKG8L7 TaxID=455556 RepID=B3TB72_9ZZZZ|nr:hypothetical protein ALOHA_HF4000APKG8L7ctg1g6 [uncultured marine microorganism HF4000_APKG8L7]